jgi:hypothetical protein
MGPTFLLVFDSRYIYIIIYIQYIYIYIDIYGFVMETPIRMDDLGVPPFQETSIYLQPLHFTEGPFICAVGAAELGEKIVVGPTSAHENATANWVSQC